MHNCLESYYLRMLRIVSLIHYAVKFNCAYNYVGAYYVDVSNNCILIIIAY